MYHVALIGFNDPAGYGRRCISSSLKRDGVRVSNILFGCDRFQDTPAMSDAAYDAFDGLMRELRPDLVAFSILSTFGHPSATRLAAQVKSGLAAPVVFGGVHPTVMPALCLGEPVVDYVCVGEGEYTIVDLCRRLLSGGATDDIPGIMSRGQANFTARSAPQDLDSLPFQDVGDDGRCSILADGSVREGDPLLNGTLHFHSTRCSRGCPFRCAFCSTEQLRDLYERGTYLRRRTPGNVIEELRGYLELNPACDFLRFWDDTFPIDRVWVEEFASLYKKHIDVPFTVWFHPNTVREENLRVLAWAGLRETVVGIESASDETRKKVYLRPERRDQILASHQLIQKHGVDLHYDIIIEHPWESPTELEDTFELMMDMSRPFKLNMHNLALFPGTRLAKRAVDEGLTTEDGILEALIGDTFDASRKLWWVKGVPRQRDVRRAYWVFLIMAAASRQIPRWFVRFLADCKLFRRHPILVTGSQVRDIGWLERHQVLAELSRRAVLGRILRVVPGVRAAINLLLKSHRFRFGLVVGYVAYRSVTRLPGVLLKEIRMRLGGVTAVERGPGELVS